MVKHDPDPLSRTLSALADPTRRAILTRLRRGPATVSQLAAPFDMTLPAISKHLKVLERAELIERGREAQWRPAALRLARLREASEWLERYRDLWETTYRRLDDLLAELKAAQEQPTPRPAKTKKRKPKR